MIMSNKTSNLKFDEGTKNKDFIIFFISGLKHIVDLL